MVRTFILARHGESEWNREERYQGRLENGLSDLGRQQAEALGRRLAGRSLAAIYTSPLRRAVETAAAVAAAEGVRVAVRQELTDVNHGEWSGLLHAEVQARWPDLHRQWQQRPASVRFPGGESLMEVRDRALGFLAFARQQHADGTLLVITHGEIVQLLLASFLDMQPDQLWTLPRDNCAISVIDDYEVPLVMAVNDSCHLDGVRSRLQAQVR